MEEKRVRDLMLLLDEYATVASHATLQEALLELSKAQLGLTYDRHHHRAVLVLDQAGRVVGKLSHAAVLCSLEPKFFGTDAVESLRRVNLNEEFIHSVAQRSQVFHGSLEHMCDVAARMRVVEAMVPTHESIDENATLVDAIHRLVESNVQSMLVTRDGDVIGVLRLSDVFEEVADLIRATARA